MTDKKPKKPEPKLSAADKARLNVTTADDLAKAMANEEAAAHVMAKYEKHAATVGATLTTPIDLRPACACCGNPKSGGVACVVCGN